MLALWLLIEPFNKYLGMAAVSRPHARSPPPPPPPQNNSEKPPSGAVGARKSFSIKGTLLCLWSKAGCD